MTIAPVTLQTDIGPMPAEIRAALAPEGRLRAGINLSNPLLVTGRTAAGDPTGVSPSMAAEIARLLGLGIAYMPYPNPGALADAAARGEWDIGLIGAEPQRAETIAFTPAYAQIEATYLVPAASPLKSVAEVDRPGLRIALSDRSAYGLWLDRNIVHAELRRVVGLDASLKLFLDERLDALAGLRPRLDGDAAALPGARVLPGHFMLVRQAIGVPRAKAAALPWLERFRNAAVREGFVARLIAQFGVSGLSVPEA